MSGITVLKKLTTAFLLLTGTGVGLTLYLPAVNIPVPTQFSIDEQSLKSPLPGQELVLSAVTNDEQQFALQLGLYNDLQRAAKAAKQLTLNDQIDIITIQNNKQSWHALLLGPFTTSTEAHNMQLRLDNENSIRSSLVRWPKPQPEKGS